ncbi:transposable element Tcb1 transposase [Trichonephila clavipes]|nr:transposable element Tcb1 transposase [Trichonephila clavipes]
MQVTVRFCSFPPKFSGRTPWWWLKASHLSFSPFKLTRGLAARQVFRVSLCREGTIHLQTSMPSPGLEPRSYVIAVSATNYSSEWAENEVVFTEESHMCLQHHDGRIRVWRHREERMLNSCVMPHHTGPAPCIMIELPPWPARSPVFSPIEDMWSMVAQRKTHITPPAATQDQLWQHVEAAWSAVPQEHIQSLFESMLRRVAAVIYNNGGYSGY